MKAKYIFAASLLAAGAAFADTTEVDTEYVIGVMPVSVGNETIIAIPWVESGGGSDGIAVTNLIKTSTLAVGDTLYWYDTNTGKYHSWRVASGSPNYWESVQVVDDGSRVGTDAVIAATQTVLNRGQALFLKRATNSEATNVYVVGQYTNAVANTRVTAIKARVSETVPSYTLLAPPYESTLGSYAGYVDLNSASIDWGNVNRGDVIIIGIKNGRQDVFVRGKINSVFYWGTYSGSEFTAEAKVPVGTGFWYKSYRKEDGAVTWN